MARIPTGAKRPSDHLSAVKRPQDPASDSSVSDVDEIVTPGQSTIEFDGEVYQIDFDAINDIEVLEAFQRPGFMGPDMNGAITALQKALGPEYERFKEDQVAKHGRCKATALAALFREVDRQAPGN